MIFNWSYWKCMLIYCNLQMRKYASQISHCSKSNWLMTSTVVLWFLPYMYSKVTSPWLFPANDCVEGMLLWQVLFHEIHYSCRWRLWLGEPCPLPQSVSLNCLQTTLKSTFPFFPFLSQAEICTWGWHLPISSDSLLSFPPRHFFFQWSLACLFILTSSHRTWTNYFHIYES